MAMFKAHDVGRSDICILVCFIRVVSCYSSLCCEGELGDHVTNFVGGLARFSCSSLLLLFLGNLLLRGFGLYSLRALSHLAKVIGLLILAGAASRPRTFLDICSYRSTLVLFHGCIQFRLLIKALICCVFEDIWAFSTNDSSSVVSVC